MTATATPTTAPPTGPDPDRFTAVAPGWWVTNFGGMLVTGMRRL